MLIPRTVDAPFIMVLFGGTGDLARRKVLPSLFALFKQGYLPKVFQIIATGRRSATKEDYFDSIKEFLPSDGLVADFIAHIEYAHIDLHDLASFEALRDRIHELETTTHKECVSKLYYMALTPDILETAIQNIGKVGLHIGCGGEEEKWARIIIEKPFGQDLASAKRLNELLLQYFQEEQIYRIDHYLGKELVQTILSVRFANAMFYPLLNNQYIERIELTAFETLGMEGRGAFYDQTGALKDFVQSHLLQLIALATMSEPASFDAEVLRESKAKALSAIRLFDESNISTDMIHGQYEGYRQEEHVHPNSLTETYVAFKIYVDLPQWSGVPVYVRHGKKMKEKNTAIDFVFKPHCGVLYCERPDVLREDVRRNVLSILLAPEEGFKLRTNIKHVGFGTGLHDVNLKYSYHESAENVPDAYERLLMDAMSGDQSLYIRSDEIEQSWKWVDRVFELWKSHKPELHNYAAGSMGPESSIR